MSNRMRDLVVIGGVVCGSMLTACNQNGPNDRSIKVRFGKPEHKVLGSGLHFYNPMTTAIRKISVAHSTTEIEVDAFSSDLQDVKLNVKVVYNIPEDSVFKILTDYKGDVIHNFIIPKIQEAIKEVTATRTANDIVKFRNEIKDQSLALAKKKVDGLVDINDIVIVNIELTKALQQAIENKMIQQQYAEQSKFVQQKASIDAKTKIITAEGEAQSLAITGKALSDNPQILQLEMIKKWNGILPATFLDSKGISSVFSLNKYAAKPE